MGGLGEALCGWFGCDCCCLWLHCCFLGFELYRYRLDAVCLVVWVLLLTFAGWCCRVSVWAKSRLMIALCWFRFDGLSLYWALVAYYLDLWVVVTCVFGVWWS